MNFKFKVGDRVTRPLGINDKILRRGTIIRCYLDSLSSFNKQNELYEVKWDDGSIELGYFANGLEREQ